MMKQWLDIADEIKQIYSGKEFVPLHEPTLGEKESEYVTDCIKSGWVSSVGKYVDQFEKQLAEYVGVKRAVAVVNGTAALHIALKMAGVQPGDEVFMPSLTFVATANAASYLQAVPHFVDVSKETLGLDPYKLEEHILKIGELKNGELINRNTGRIIRAVVPMHTFGHPVDIDQLLIVCERYHLALVEDAAESLGSLYKGKHAGSFGVAGAVSFNGNKIITTGGGGAILTNDEELANYAKHITTTAKLPHRWEYNHDELGYNYRMPNLNAALGCAQLEKIEYFVLSKRALVNKYKLIFENFDGVSVFEEGTQVKSNYWLQTLVIDRKKHTLEKVLEVLNASGIMARPVWTPMHKLSIFENSPQSNLEVTNYLAESLINIPSTPLKGEEE